MSTEKMGMKAIVALVEPMVRSSLSGHCVAKEERT
jgi:hypothetical protein